MTDRTGWSIKGKYATEMPTSYISIDTYTTKILVLWSVKNNIIYITAELMVPLLA